MNKDRKIGKSFPLGATVCPDGVNFSVFAKGGEAVQLLLFDHVDNAQEREPSRSIRLLTAAVTIGMSLCLGSKSDRFTVTE